MPNLTYLPTYLLTYLLLLYTRYTMLFPSPSVGGRRWAAERVVVGKRREGGKMSSYPLTSGVFFLGGEGRIRH
ncbi:hypothetical protein F4809DRAFT_622505 [Biscogniauxia mediterranea]|nr:hypothetical protein F4809DRAFT_622505 [Biscogniauxia mediterranea]